MKKFFVYIIEDDEKLYKQYCSVAEAYGNIKIIGGSDNTKTALSDVKKLKPDVILLDLEFQNTSGNGINFLKRLSNIRNFKKPFILVCTNNISEITQKIARTYGADYIISKQQHDFSATLPFEYINSFSDVLYETLHPSTIPISKEYTDGEKLKVIRQELLTLKMNPKYKGFKYLESAIFLSLTTVVKNKSEICNILAEKYTKTNVNIEQSMQNAINNCWNGNLSDIEKVYTAPYTHSDKCDKDPRPTTKEFIEFFVDKLKMYDCFKDQDIL